MNKQFSFTKQFLSLTIFGAILLNLTTAVFAQTPVSANPTQDKLLNGLKVLTWRAPDAQKVTVKIRIHSGSAFDPQGKEGLMNLLAENIFPTQTARDFFAEDLGGSLEIISNYDYIQINASGSTEEFLTVLQTLASAVSTPTIDKETTAKLKAAQLDKIKELEKNPAYIADRTAAQRLLGTFPYGRAQAGTLASIQKIDFADLLFAKERFLTADNSTIAIVGNVRPEFALRAAKRFFGGWQKSENRVPSSFRQPDAPDPKPFEVSLSGAENTSEIRYAMRGLARNDKDFAASEIFTKIVQNRLQNYSVKQNFSNAFARHQEHILPGLVLLGYSARNAAPEAATNEMIANAAALLMSQAVSNEEFLAAKNAVLSEYKARNPVDLWFDAETFKLVSAADETKSFEAVALADVQRVAERLAKNPSVMVSVIQKNSEATTN